MFKLQDILREGEGGEGSNAGGDGGAGVADPPADAAPSSTPQGGQGASDAGGQGNESRSIFQGDPAAPDGQPAPQGDGKPEVNDTRPPGDVVSKPFHIGLYGEDGKINKDALDRLPEHLKKDKSIFEQYNTIEEVLHAFANSKRMNGRKGDLSAYERPGEDAPESAKQQHEQFLKVANGAPDTIEGYGLTKPEGVADDAWNQEQANQYAEIAMKHHASPELMRELAELNAKTMADSQAEMAKANQAYFSGEVEALKNEHRSAFPEVRAQAERVVNRFGMDDAAMSSAANVNALYKIAKSLGEDRLPSHSSDPSAGITDRQKAMAILKDPSNPYYKAYHDPNDRGHDEAVALRSKLNQSWTESQKK